MNTNEACRQILDAVLQRAEQIMFAKEPDYRAMAEQLRQSAALMQAELETADERELIDAGR